MEYLKVKNWDEFQHYKNRTPPWIKLHRDLLRDYDFTCLQDASKLHLILLWLLASQLDNKIPTDPKWITRQLGLSKPVNLKPLIDNGFIFLVQDASKVLADCKQSAIVETETEAYKEETEREEVLPKEKRPASRRTRLPENWKLTAKLRNYCHEKRPDLNPEETAEAFIDFWLGDGRVKADWDRAFMTWVRNEKPRRKNGTGKSETTVQARNRRNREAIERAQTHDHGGHVAADV